MNTSRRRWIVVVTVAFGLVIAIALGETTLRVVAYLMLQGVPDYADTMTAGLLRPGFSANVVGADGQPVRWTNNAQGFRAEREFTPQPAPGTLRVLSLGDSFTAGYRVGDDETFSKLLEVRLNEVLGPTEVLINGIEDPDNGLRYFRETGTGWSPHVLLFGITLGNDVAQAYVSRSPTPIGFRNGLEQLVLPPESLERPTAGTILLREIRYAALRSRLFGLIYPRRAIISWYGHAFPPRLFDPINGFGMYLADAPAEIDEAYHRLLASLDEISAVSAERDVHLVVAVFPQRYQVQAEDWAAARRAYGLSDTAFDLDAPNRRIADWCFERGVDCVDPTGFMRSAHEATGEDYYQPLGDMHWNAPGHRIWVEGAESEMLRILRPIVEGLRSETGADPAATAPGR